MTKLKLYVWTDFCPDCIGGIAFAIAETVDEAKRLVVLEHGAAYNHVCVWDWGTLTIHDIEKRAYCVEGGGYRRSF